MLSPSALENASLTPRRSAFTSYQAVPVDDFECTEADLKLLASEKLELSRRSFENARHHTTSQYQSASFSIKLCLLLSLLALSFFCVALFTPHFNHDAAPSLEEPSLSEMIPLQPVSFNSSSLWPVQPLTYRKQCQQTPMQHSHFTYFELIPQSEFESQQIADDNDRRICEKTLIFQLSPHVGLARQMTAMALAYGLAKEDDRQFFIEDSHWNRGKWSDHFQRLPEPGCSMPFPEDVQACPRSTRHWLLNSHTVGFHFGHDYQDYFEDPKARDVWRKKPIYLSARLAFTDGLFAPNALNQRLIDLALSEMSSDWIGVHVRRGDRTLYSAPHSTKGMDYPAYILAMKEAFMLLTDDFLNGYESVQMKEPHFWLASDSRNSLTDIRAFAPRHPFDIKWHFHSLKDSRYASLRTLLSPFQEGYQQDVFNLFTSDTAILNTRGQIVDLALLGGLKPDLREDKRRTAMICTISSDVCKLSAEMLGWEKAFEARRWINIDNRDGYDWQPLEFQ